ncbi:N-acetyl-gamma-glutamyl-phosphate reductase [archaeon]|nr:N-acetyl-gamma-glutamyl-phosphate reductase [archaeon]
MMKVGIIGASGYTGSELLRILAGHRECEVVCATSRRYEGKDVSLVNQNLRGIIDLKFENMTVSEVAKKSDFVFCATPHGTSMDIVPELVKSGVKVVDLSGDFRFNDIATYEKYYDKKHTAHDIKAVYGLPELHRTKIKEAELVANPGCYPTSAILGLAPLVSEDLIDLEKIVVDSKSGISGAGATPKPATHYTMAADSVSAYKVTSHQHMPEIEQELNLLKEGVKVSFVPHIVPVIRGLSSTIHVFLERDVSTDDIHSIYEDFYTGEPFVRVLGAGVIPRMSAVRGTNYADIGSFEVDYDRKRAVIVSVIDNLVKGASGQAVQNMNIMMGFDETEGLKSIGIHP